MYDLVSLGEVMLRLAPPGTQRLRQAATLEVRVCGAQFNVAADLAQLGRKTAFLTKLPDSELGMLARGICLGFGVDLSHVLAVPNRRIGLVCVEFATEPRRSVHLYDRQFSAATTIAPGDFDWSAVLKGTRLAYTDGIFFALSDSCRESALEFVRAARANESEVCFDMNYREALWTVEEARRGYQSILPYVDVLVTNRWVSEVLFDESGDDEDLLQRYRAEFGCRTVCLTQRYMNDGQRGRWKSIALHQNETHESRQVEFSVVDRLGTGDAFFAGFLHGYLEGDIAFALEFGNALCALAHTVPGDVAQVSADEVMSLISHGCVGSATFLKR